VRWPLGGPQRCETVSLFLNPAFPGELLSVPACTRAVHRVHLAIRTLNWLRRTGNSNRRMAGVVPEVRTHGFHVPRSPRNVSRRPPHRICTSLTVESDTLRPDPSLIAQAQAVDPPAEQFGSATCAPFMISLCNFLASWKYPRYELEVDGIDL